jgi:hypothetical protein
MFTNFNKAMFVYVLDLDECIEVHGACSQQCVTIDI